MCVELKVVGMGCAASGRVRGHDTVVIGTSAGGIEALLQLASSLEPGLPITLFVALHMAVDWKSDLPRLLTSAGAYPASFVRGGEAIVPSQILISPPDRHLILRDGRVELSHGPRENFWRPSIDVLFRSAALSCGSRVVGVILSGTLDDGAAGLASIVARGGAALVQEPTEAIARGMPDSALRACPSAESLIVTDIARRLAQLAREEPQPEIAASDELKLQVRIAEGGGSAAEDYEGRGEPTIFTCPECSGPLRRNADGAGGYRCHVGHAYSERSLFEYTHREAESSLWSAVRLFQQRAALCRTLAERERKAGRQTTASTYDTRANESDAHARVLRTLLINPAADTGH